MLSQEISDVCLEKKITSIPQTPLSKPANLNLKKVGTIKFGSQLIPLTSTSFAVCKENEVHVCSSCPETNVLRLVHSFTMPFSTDLFSASTLVQIGGEKVVGIVSLIIVVMCLKNRSCSFFRK